MAQLSHIVGILKTGPNPVIGPDSGPSSSQNTWTFELPSSPERETKFLILHFTNAKLPGNNRVEVFLGYTTEVFRAVQGTDFWTRPINVYPLAGQPVVIKYITDGATTGGVQLKEYGVGVPHVGELNHPSLSNCDPFFTGAKYTEPKYDPFWACTDQPNWENAACVTDPTDVRARVSRSVGMIVTVERNSANTETIVSTCTGTLIDSDQVITAGHCFNAKEDALTSSITFDYQTDCDRNRLPNYNPRFFKVKEHLKHQPNPGGIDYSWLRLAEVPTGVPPVQIRPNIPAPNEQVFGIHHPNGAVKKLSIPHPGFDTVGTSSATAITVHKTFHVSGGSSGSALFDTAGRVLGVLSFGDPCGRTPTPGPLQYFPMASILKDFAPSPPPPVTRDVMIVFDRSGSMSELDPTGRTKIVVAQDAVSLFVQLIRRGAGNRVGLVSFSTTATMPTIDFPIVSVVDANKQALIGPPPFAGGEVGRLVAGGSTSIGEGLDAARLQFPVPGINPRAILLMTDGMQNTPRLIDAVEGMLTGIDIHAVGFGTDANLNGDLLNKLATTHNGAYTRAGSSVALEKFFSHAFGNIFEAGILMDPEFDLLRNQSASQPIGFNVCGEDTVTAAVGWDNVNGTLAIELTTPNGVTITGGSANVEEALGRTWTFLRVPLPHGGERDGLWNATVFRQSDSASVPLHYFINIIPTGGARLFRARDDRLYYTGDRINPLVFLRLLDGSVPTGAKVQLTLSRPNASIGSILSHEGLHAPVTIAGDTIPARQATIGNIQQRSEAPITTLVDETFDLSDDSFNTIGVFEEVALFGKPLSDKLVTEGDYLFHFRATYGQGCTATRELLWSIHVDVGIDPSHTSITTNFTNTGSDGQLVGTVTIIPRDRYDNGLGPGRSDGVSITGSAGTTITGPAVDNGDGSYTVPIVWNPGSGNPPIVIIGQPGRPPVVTQQPGACKPQCCRPDKCGHHHCRGGPHDGGHDCGHDGGKHDGKRNNGHGDEHDCVDDDKHHGRHEGGLDENWPHETHKSWPEQKRNINSRPNSIQQLSPTNVRAVVPVLIIFLTLVGIITFLRRRRNGCLSRSSVSEQQDHQPLFVDK